MEAGQVWVKMSITGKVRQEMDIKMEKKKRFYTLFITKDGQFEQSIDRGMT